MEELERLKARLNNPRTKQESEIVSLITKIRRAKNERYFEEITISLLKEKYTVKEIQNGYKIINSVNKKHADYYPLRRRLFNISEQKWLTIHRNSWVMFAIESAVK